MIAPNDFVSRQENMATPVISQLDINGETVRPYWRDKNSPAEQQITWLDELELNYQQNFLTFYFSALDFSDPAKNRIEYRLLGFDDEWQFS